MSGDGCGLVATEEWFLRRKRLLDSGHGDAFSVASLRRASAVRAVFRTGVREQRHLETGSPVGYPVPPKLHFPALEACTLFRSVSRSSPPSWP